MDCSSLADVIDCFIDSYRHEVQPAAVIDVAMGIMRLCEEERRVAVMELCRSLIRHEACMLPAHLVLIAAEKICIGSPLDAATLAIALCGVDGARHRFPMDDSGALD